MIGVLNKYATAASEEPTTAPKSGRNLKAGHDSPNISFSIPSADLQWTDYWTMKKLLLFTN